MEGREDTHGDGREEREEEESLGEFGSSSMPIFLFMQEPQGPPHFPLNLLPPT